MLKRALATFHSPPRFWKRFVDDTCTALPRNMVKLFHSHLDSIEPCIQLTVEEESANRTLPFLDIQLCRDLDGTVTTSVYRKATPTEQYLTFASRYPVAHKGAVVRTLMSRADTVILGCAMSEGGEEDCRGTKRERSPLQLYSQTLMPNQMQTRSG